MFDRFLYPAIAPYCAAMAKPLLRLGMSANIVTIVAFAIGMAALPLLALGQFGWALVAIMLNRLLDGVDGAMARLAGPTDRGAFLDIALDFLFYGSVPLGFALFDPAANALAACFLLFSFIGTGATFLAYSLIGERRGLGSRHFAGKGIIYLSGLAEGFETILAFAAMCLWPFHFPKLAIVFAVLCVVTTIARLIAAWRRLA
ncbi:MAG TPA: CDP-alcohol phosphatidyltransferase family protein [Aestuariivirgaceae bacterium]